MANVASVHLSDLDIRRLEVKNTRYARAVGDPKELYIFVNPKGTKKFSLRIRQNDKATWYELKEFRDGIYSVNEARRDALKKLKDLEKADGNIEILKSGNEKYSFGNLFKEFIENKRIKGCGEDYLKKVIQQSEKYLLPSLKNRDIKDIKRSDLLAILRAIFKPQTPKESRLDTVHRLISYLHDVFKIAIKDRYLEFDPSFALSDEFPSVKKFYITHGIDGRQPAIHDTQKLKEFIVDLKNSNLSKFTRDLKCTTLAV